jgi:hypothetical protein
MSCKLEMVPPPGEVLGRVAVDSERRVAAEVRLRNGQSERDCWRRASMIDDSVRFVNIILISRRDR